MDIIQFSENIKQKSEKFASVVSACKSLFRNSPLAEEERAYMKNRLSDYSLDKYNIGYFPNNKNINTLIELVGKDVLEELNLIKEGRINNRSHIDIFNKSYFNYHNIIFPFKDEYGNIIALAGRTLLDKQSQDQLKVPKYKNTRFSKALHLYGLYEAKNSIEKNGFVIIVEGQIDCISCQANGYFNTVALTSASLTDYQLYILKKMTNNIYLLLDNDEAGKKSAKKSIRKYSKFINIKSIDIPDPFKDIDDYLHKSEKRDIFNQCYQSGGV